MHETVARGGYTVRSARTARCPSSVVLSDHPSAAMAKVSHPLSNQPASQEHKPRVSSQLPWPEQSFGHRNRGGAGAPPGGGGGYVWTGVGGMDGIGVEKRVGAAVVGAGVSVVGVADVGASDGTPVSVDPGLNVGTSVAVGASVGHVASTSH